MQVVETIRFTRKAARLLDDASLFALIDALADRPDLGTLIERGGGLRKVRWARAGTGKSGGVRVIYYWQDAEGEITLADIYAKNEKPNLKDAELKTLRKELDL